MHNCIYTSNETTCQSTSRKNWQENRFGIVFMKWSDQYEVHDFFPDGLTKPAVKRLLEVLPWCYVKFITSAGTSRVVEVSSKELQKVLGNTRLGEQLGKLLFYIEDTTWDYGQNPHCKRYMLNKRMFKTLMALVGIDEQYLIFQEAQKLKEKYADELATGKFNYERKAYRDYHELISTPSRIRDYIAASSGYIYEVDVSSCAPVAIIGLAKKVNIQFNYSFLDHYLKNPKAVRERIAKKCGFGVDVKLVKQVINAAIHGADFHRYGQIYEYCGGSGIKLFRLAINKTLRKLIRELHFLIHRLEEEGQIIIPKDFDKELTFGRKVFLIYSRVEDQLRTKWKDFIEHRGGKVLQVHDGFYTNFELITMELEQFLEQETNIKVKLELEIVPVDAIQVLELNTIDC